jgi:hypothetical protein
MSSSYVFFFGACTEAQTQCIRQALTSTRIPAAMQIAPTRRGHKVIVTGVVLTDALDLDKVLKQRGAPPCEIKPANGQIARKRLWRMGL